MEHSDTIRSRKTWFAKTPPTVRPLLRASSFWTDLTEIKIAAKSKYLYLHVNTAQVNLPKERHLHHDDGPEDNHGKIQFPGSSRSVSERQRETGNKHTKIHPLENHTQDLSRRESNLLGRQAHR